MRQSVGMYRQFIWSQNYGSLLKKLNLKQTFVAYFGHNICLLSFTAFALVQLQILAYMQLNLKDNFPW